MRTGIMLFALAASVAVSAQSLERQVIGSAGDYATGGNVSLSYTVGETATATLSGGNLILTQGFQQPDDQMTGIDEPVFNGEITVYPNPTSDIVMINITSDDDLILELTNVSGQQLMNRELVFQSGNYSGQVDLQKYAAGTYLLYLRDSEGRVVTNYKVQKIN